MPQRAVKGSGSVRAAGVFELHDQAAAEGFPGIRSQLAMENAAGEPLGRGVRYLVIRSVHPQHERISRARIQANLGIERELVSVRDQSELSGRDRGRELTAARRLIAG